MAIVGRQFPSIDVDAMNEMGDTFKLNVLEEAKNKNKKVLLFGILKISLLYALLNYMLFKLL